MKIIRTLLLFLAFASVAQAAVVTRYFSTSSAGAGDGTTWADRAALYSGAWSSIITGFAFNGSDSLLCYIGPGTYSIGGSLGGATFTVAQPTAANTLVMHGCDGSGNPLTPPDPLWTADRLPWDDSSLPVLAVTTNQSVWAVANMSTRLLKFTGTANTTNAVIGASGQQLDWCVVTSSSSNTSAIVCALGTASTLSNCVLVATGSAYNAISSGAFLYNTRLVGNISATTGNRYGWTTASVGMTAVKSCVIDNPGGGLVHTSSSASAQVGLYWCVFNNNGAEALKLSSAASQSIVGRIVGCYIANHTTYGINAQSAAHVLAINNRLRDNGTDFSGVGSKPTTELNYTTDSSDADEYVDAGSGDFRIKASATIAPMGFGISVAKPTVAH